MGSVTTTRAAGNASKSKTARIWVQGGKIMGFVAEVTQICFPELTQGIFT
jgi:hypothetical protein